MNNDNNVEWTYEVFHGIITIIGSAIFFGMCGWFFTKSGDHMTRITLIPFLVCGLSVLIRGIIVLIRGLILRKGMKDENISAERVFDKYEKLNIAEKTFSKVYVIGFLVFWFGLLILCDYFAIKQGQLLMLAFSLIFWIAGIYIAIKNLKG